MPRKIILIALDWTRPKDPARSLGHASILANLLAHGIQVIEKSWSVNSPDFKIKDVIDFIGVYTDIDTFIAFGAFVWNEFHIQNILAAIKREKIPGTIIIGGPQISYTRSEPVDIEDYCRFGKGVLEALYPHADIFIRGYAESALAELMLSTDTRKIIAGVHYKNTEDDNSMGIVDLAKLPSPLLQGLIQPKNFLRWETKRGCPFKCAFCQHKASEASRYYEFPFDRIVQEARWVSSHSEIRNIVIVDPTFNITGTHYLDVLQELIYLKYGGKLALQCRIELVTDDFLDTVAALNHTAQVILEFGLQTINEQEEVAIQRRNHHVTVNRVLRQCIEREIRIEVSLIYGLPLQTVDSFVSSAQFLVDLGVPTIRAWPLMLLRGTKLYEIKEQYGLTESRETIPHVISSHSFSSREYERMQVIADSLQIYNQLTKEEQAQWDVTQQKPHTASLSYAHAILFFRQHKDLLTADYVTAMRHNDPALQQIYDERFGLVLSKK